MSRATRMDIAVSLLAAATVLCGDAVTFGADPFPATLPGTEIGGGLPGGYEPSGAVWHTDLDKLLTVSDGGIVTHMDADGSNVTNWPIGGDLEGICVADPNSSFVYIGVENPDSILEFNIGTGLLTRSFDLTGTMTGPSNAGLEGLTFVPDAGDAEGGLFYAGLQADGNIYTFRLPILSSSTATTVTPISTITPVVGRTDISGLHYDVDHEVLYAIFDSSDVLRAMQADGTFIAEWQLAGNDQEGITLGGTDLFIAEDVGTEVWRYSSFPVVVPGDINSDGVVDVGDLALVGAQWGTSGSPTFDADIAPFPTGDGTVDVGDLALVGARWDGATTGSSLRGKTATVPVPGAEMAVLSLLSVVGVARKRRVACGC